MAILAVLGLAPVARASRDDGGPHATLTAAFTPLRLGRPTTVSFAVRIDPPALSAPPPISAIEVNYPRNLGLATSGLGLEACDPQRLATQGTSACPPDSKMGEGSALVEVPFGPGIVEEAVHLDTYAAPSPDGYLHLSILAHGQEPVIASVVLSAVLLPGRLLITVPAIASLPGAPNASLVGMRASLGGALTYYERAHGRTVAYRPQGIGLPDSCPRGGWKVAAKFTFLDGSATRARTAVRCPARH